jgi:hypothetical protein
MGGKRRDGSKEASRKVRKEELRALKTSTCWIISYERGCLNEWGIFQ